MAYQSKYKGAEVEYILDNALLKKEQTLTDVEKQRVKSNLGIEDPDLTNYATKKEVEDAINNIPTPDVGGQISAALVYYVKKEEGKGLSTNDFTDELKSKLDGIKTEKDDLMAIELSEVGEMILIYGEETNLLDGYISEDGELVLEFNFE